MPDVPPRVRHHGLDWLRAVAALLVVALHAGIAYMIVPMPGLAWATQDPVGSPVVDAIVWWIDSFVMPLFVLIGGFLAAQLFAAQGPDEFLKHRTKRLLGPFVFACVVILPLDLYAWLLSWAAQGMIPLKKLRSLKVDPPLDDHLWGVSHLWFLEYLWLFCVVAWGVGRLGGGMSNVRIQMTKEARVSKPEARGDRRGLVIRASSFLHHLGFDTRHYTPAVLMTVSALALWWQPQVLIGFRHSWWPLSANVLFYVPWFALGWTMFGQWGRSVGRISNPSECQTPGVSTRTSSSFGDRTSTSLQLRNPEAQHRVSGPESESERSDGLEIGPTVSRRGILGCEVRVAVSLALFAVLLPLIREHLRGGLAGWPFGWLISLFVLHAWLAVTGWFGVCLKWLNREPPPVVKYVAEASFWIYLFHHPVVGLTQANLARLGVPIVAKFALTLAVATTLSLLTYQAFVRHTWVGALLNGRRVPRRTDFQSVPFDRRDHRLPDGLDIRPTVPAAEPLRKTA